MQTEAKRFLSPFYCHRNKFYFIIILELLINLSNRKKIIGKLAQGSANVEG